MNEMPKQTLQLKQLLASLTFLVASLSLLQTAYAAEGDVWQVAVTIGNVRAQPQPNAELVNQLPKGTHVVELQRQGVWLQIEAPDGSKAWMHQITLNQTQITLNQTVQLFDLALNSVDRKAMRQALDLAPIAVIREDDAYPYDLYDPSEWRQGATEMTLGYTLKEQLFAVAEIAFRSTNDVEQVRLVAEEVRKELGPWQRVLGRRAEGPVEFEWQRGDLRILVHRGWPDTTTYIVYEVSNRLDEIQVELEPR